MLKNGLLVSKAGGSFITRAQSLGCVRMDGGRMQKGFCSQEDTPLLGHTTISLCCGHVSGLALTCPQMADTFFSKHSLILAAVSK